MPNYKRDDVILGTDGPLEMPLSGSEVWGASDRWPIGKCAFFVRGMTVAREKEGNMTGVIDLECVSGPDDTDDKKGDHYMWRTNVFSAKKNSWAGRNFFNGVLDQIAPGSLIDANRMKDAKGESYPNKAYYVGAKVAVTFVEETYKDPNNGKEKTSVKPKGKVELLEPSPFARQKLGLAGSSAAPGNGAAAGNIVATPDFNPAS